MIILVTGATSGFGLEISRSLVNDGHIVVGTGRRHERLAEIQAELGERFIARALDVSSRDEVLATVDAIEREVGAIDALINNAGLALGLESAEQSSLDDWDEMINTNIRGLVYCTHAALPHMVKRQAGWIINLGSTAGTYPYPGGNVYGATKAFVHQFSLNLRSDLAGKKVRVTSIEPGLCGGTEFSNVRFKGDDTAANNVYAGTDPLTARDIADTVRWILALPEHVNINAIEMMPTCQAPGPMIVRRNNQ
ncbi:SDR family NAD(P)-dependent oxidoreductase [Pseudomonas putida]|uniref:SDR family NAD(P)-dependent oxidoreductase n=1 Tax=Pseudomonas putida group TaxID=136845 RepID=UPI00383B76D4